ncbi:MAG: fimbrial protein [Geobacter sp.]|nr:fimbrial protein [Geobacter sp.]
MRLTINLSTRTYINHGQLNLALSLVFLVLFGILTLNILGISSRAGEASRISGELTAMQKKTAVSSGPAFTEPDYQRLMSHIHFANSVISRKTFNWVTLLDYLESVVPDGVAVTKIEPDPKTKVLKLSGATLSFMRLRQLLENMEQSQHFSEIFLLSQTDAKVGDAQKGISFNITCQVKMQ